MSYSYGRNDYSSSSAVQSTNPFDEPERQPTEQERLHSQILDVQQQSKSSTQRSLALLYQTEEVGEKTAEELVRQGERLDSIEGKVTKIDADLKQTQKHINGLKSVFGGITNWWQSKKERKSKEEPNPYTNENSGLRTVMKKSQSEHSTFATSAKPARERVTAGSSIQAVIEQNEEDLEEDLGQMSVLTDRLKFMALAMGEEMDKHNQKLDRINDKVGRTEMTMSGQNKQMNKILKG